MKSTKPEILNRKDIELLLNSFYEKVLNDKTINRFFEDIDLEKHLPIITDFWCSLLLNEKNYQGNPMQKHMELHQMKKLTENNFSVWLQLFYETINENFKGNKADEMKLRATNIANLMMFKINEK